MDDDLQYVKRQLADTNIKAISEKVGLSYMTVYRIANGTNTNPTHSTLKTLRDYFKAKE